jgi:ubiquitin C-terminal hydrolase
LLRNGLSADRKNFSFEEELDMSTFLINMDILEANKTAIEISVRRDNKSRDNILFDGDDGDDDDNDIYLNSVTRISTENVDDINSRYSLSSVIACIGPQRSGHYVAYVKKSNVDVLGKWWMLDDEKVENVNWERLMNYS